MGDVLGELSAVAMAVPKLSPGKVRGVAKPPWVQMSKTCNVYHSFLLLNIYCLLLPRLAKPASLFTCI